MKYAEELTRTMTWLGEKPDTLFLGQAVEYKGTAMTNTLKDVPIEKKLEMPVAEDLQMGMSIGLALGGTVPISIYPRWNFLLLATNHIVNHIDKLHLMGAEPYKTKIIIRTSIGAEKPLFPLHQHTGDFTDVFELMCRNIIVVRLDTPEQIFNSYRRAYEREDGKSTIIVEWGDAYNDPNWKVIK